MQPFFFVGRIHLRRVGTTYCIYRDTLHTRGQKYSKKSLFFRKKILAFPGWIEYTSAVRVWARGQLWPIRGSRQEVAGCHPGNFCRANASNNTRSGGKNSGQGGFPSRRMCGRKAAHKPRVRKHTAPCTAQFQKEEETITWQTKESASS